MSLELQSDAICDAKVSHFLRSSKELKKKEIIAANAMDIVLNIFRNQMKMPLTFICTELYHTHAAVFFHLMFIFLIIHRLYMQFFL